ncbi:MAG: hypothetical protein MJ075_07450, partial [Oscillospiraceae bacterium]|nr:hypothetical protein [Oscillospiraceae bacterium]
MKVSKRSYFYKKYVYLARFGLLLPFFIGLLGYLQQGYPFIKGVYGSLCFYFVSVYSTESSFLLDLARWTAPICLATGVLYSLSGFMNYLDKVRTSLHKDAVVIYCDQEELAHAQILKEDVPHAVLELLNPKTGIKLYPDVSTQVLMFGDDMKNLEFAYQNEAVLKGKTLCMKLRKIDSDLLGKSNIRYFNTNELVGSIFWEKYPLFRETGSNLADVHVAILGSGELAEKLLVGAILHNIFRLDQKITYHLFGNFDAFLALHGKSRLMNKDRILVHEDSWLNHLDLLKGMSRIVLAEEENLGNLSRLLHICPEVPLYVHSKEIVDLSKFFLSGNITCFGRDENVYTGRFILGDSRYAKGKELHYMTMLLGREEPQDPEAFKEQEWRKLDGFTQSSYRAIADYYDLYTDYLDACGIETHDLEEMTALEHIR